VCVHIVPALRCVDVERGEDVRLRMPTRYSTLFMKPWALTEVMRGAVACVQVRAVTGILRTMSHMPTASEGTLLGRLGGVLLSLRLRRSRLEHVSIIPQTWPETWVAAFTHAWPLGRLAGGGARAGPVMSCQGMPGCCAREVFANGAVGAEAGGGRLEQYLAGCLQRRDLSRAEFFQAARVAV
jgi:hypothetical protein